MSGFEGIGKLLLIVGGLIVVVGVVLSFVGRIPFIGRLPGDVSFQMGSFSVYVPVASGIVISLVATIVLNIVMRLFR